MRTYLKTVLLLCMLCDITTAWAVGVGGSCNVDNICDENLYCNTVTYTCTSCDLATHGAYPNSVAGATSINQCYKTCGDSDIIVNGVKLGTKIATGNAYYNNECAYNISCNLAVAEPSGDTCTGKCFKITLKKNLTNFEEVDKFLYEKYADGFYKYNTCSGAKLDPNTTAEPNSENGWLTPESTWFQIFKGYFSASGGGTYHFDSNGKPTSNTTNTTFDSNATLYGQWDINDYTIKYFVDNSEREGLRQTCYFPRAGATVPPEYKCAAKQPPIDTKSEGEKTLTITKWATNANGTGTIFYPGDHIEHTSGTINLYAVWESCPSGYYCASGKKPCPAGATSPSGSNIITACYISVATQFRDKLGEFTLPLDDNATINYVSVP